MEGGFAQLLLLMRWSLADRLFGPLPPLTAQRAERPRRGRGIYASPQRNPHILPLTSMDFSSVEGVVRGRRVQQLAFALADVPQAPHACQLGSHLVGKIGEVRRLPHTAAVVTRRRRTRRGALVGRERVPVGVVVHAEQHVVARRRGTPS